MNPLKVTVPNTNTIVEAEKATSIILLKRGDNTLAFDLTKSYIAPNNATITAIAATSDTIFVALKHQDKSYILTLSYTDGYMTEGTVYDIWMGGKSINNLQLSKNETILLAADSDNNTIDIFTWLEGALLHKTQLVPDDDVTQYGMMILTHDSMIVVVGQYEPEPGDVCYLVSLYAFDAVQHLRTGITVDPDSAIGYMDMNGIYINGLLICSIVNEKLVLATEQRVDMDDADVLDALQLEEALSNATKPITSALADMVNTGLGDVADTKALPKIKEGKAIDKENMVLRHHLVIQQLLNNISIAIKEDRVESMTIKTLELTEDRVRITGLEFKPRG